MKKPDISPFKERFPLWGGDLQTIATAFLPVRKCGASGSVSMEFPLKDGDTLLATLDHPATPIADRPLAILLHGVPGAEDSPYMLRMSRLLGSLGHRVLRLNWRGAGRSRAVCKHQYYAGSSDDLRELIAKLEPDLTKHGIVAIGYSIGGAILLKHLGEQKSATPLRAAASVSAPIDLLGTCRSLMRFRNGLYHEYVLSRIKREAMDDGAVLTEIEREDILAAQNLWQYDDYFTARRNGFKGAAQYYAECSAGRFIADIRIPTLVLTSLDDPWVPGDAYSGHKWLENESRSVIPLLLPRGGHVGFHGADSRQPWSDWAVANFLASQKRRAPAMA
jgi:predicted alpha/beta-fold hydrolase